MVKEQLSLESLSVVPESVIPESVVAEAVGTESVGAERKRAASPHVFSVSELNKEIRGLLEGGFPFLWIRGEISNFKPHTSGHFYFSLKDRTAQISAVMFRGFNSHLKFKPTDGMEVLIRGKVTVYEPRGNYQIFCEVMEPVGQGALQMAFEQLKKKLQAEGLFDPARKKPIPTLPKRVAIVTSPTGAAIQDMLNVLSRRFRGLEITVFPTAVQGASAAKEIAAAIKLANQVGGFDVMIVGRGGGSMEDLWSFNEEIVVRALSASRIPTVSAVGHEVDFTIADFVADLRAPTPSAAAELIVKNAGDLVRQIEIREQQLLVLMRRRWQLNKQQLVGLEKRLIDPKRRLMDLIQKCDELDLRLEASIGRVVNNFRSQVVLLRERMGSPAEKVIRVKQGLLAQVQRLQLLMQRNLDRGVHRTAKAASLLDSLSPLRVLDRGYAMVSRDQRLVKSVSEVQIGESVRIRLSDGELAAEIKSVMKS